MEPTLLFMNDNGMNGDHVHVLILLIADPMMENRRVDPKKDDAKNCS